ncbi:glycosyl hydrolase [Halalkalicoccus tibetensis]|uniref:Glycosyl hydrolase n=1 Tax=Halalkalicoccus tibetensis TaxID=175632 RepID=A0ABD5V2M2_9EURY
MDRRRFIAHTTAMTCPCIALAGCTDERNGSTADSTEDDDEEPPDSDEEVNEEQNDVEHDGEPITDYDLEVHDERSNGHVFWVDHNERMYGGRSNRVLISDDWWETTETLYTVTEHEDTNDYIQSVIVPESGRVVVGVGGRADKTTGRVILLDEDVEDHETVYEFDWGRVSNSLAHVVYEDIIVIGSYGQSDFEDGNHPNEVILSTDGGESFNRILEAELRTEDAPNLHIHDVEYDPHAERIWVAVGDNANTQLHWSDDLGDSWEQIGETGEAPMVTQISAFEDCIVLGTDGTPEGIIRWERDTPDEEPDGVEEFEHHSTLQFETDNDRMQTFARRRWHIREDDGRELCLMPFGYSPMNPDATDSVLLASTDGDAWYELYRTETQDILLSNVMGPLSMDGDLRTLVSDSFQSGGHQIDATVPEFWE